MDFKTAGESHGKALISIITDYPSGIPIDLNFIGLQLSRRQKGYGRGGRMTIESDKVEILSGIRKGITTGSPISFMIRNRDWKNWKEIMDIFPENNMKPEEEPILTPRPGHADLTGMIKYRLKTIRDVIERSSARETAAKVCVGAFALSVLNILRIEVLSYVDRIGEVKLKNEPDIKNKDLYSIIEDSDVRCPHKQTSRGMKHSIDMAKKKGDSLGGSFKIIVKNVPPGLGSYTEWEKRLDARLAFSVMGIPAVKAFEIGRGFESGSMTGLIFHDEISYTRKNGFYRKTNNAGGIEGGMTNGEDIIIGAVMKPIPTTTRGMKTTSIDSKKASVSLRERSDICAVPSAAVVGEAVVAIELLKIIQDKFGRDNIDEMMENLRNYKKYLKNI